MRNQIELHEESIAFGLGRTQLLLIFSLASLALWIGFAKLAVPPMIESAYRGESFRFLNETIKEQAQYPVEHYLEKWDRNAARVLVAGLAFWIVTFLITSRAFFRKFVGEATPGTLGAIRMWTCAILLIITVWDDLGSLALLPPEYRMDMGLMRVFHEGPFGGVFNAFLTNETAMRLFQRVTELVLILGVIGWQTRIIIPLATLLAFVFNGILREYSGFWHQGLIPIYVMAVLCFTPCGDGCSLDRLRKLYRGEAVPDSATTSTVYGWGRYICWSVIALAYSAAGLSKLRTSGLEWMSASSFRGMLYEQTLYPRGSNFSLALHLVSAPDIVFVLLAIAAICGEVFFVAVLFSRRARLILPATIFMMHVGIILLQNIVFFDFMLILLIYYDFSVVTKKFGAWLRNRKPVQVLYDGLCPFCRRTVRVLAAMDLFRRLEFLDFRALNLAEYGQTHGVALTAEALNNEMCVVSRGRSYGGFEGYRLIALSIPALWLLVPFLFLPGMARIGKSVYGYVARKRLAFVKCDTDCPVEILAIQNGSKVPARNTARALLVYGISTAVLITWMGTFWVFGLEYYPFTDMHMFATA